MIIKNEFGVQKGTESKDGQFKKVEKVINRLKEKKGQFNCICECGDATLTKEGFEIWINRYSGEDGLLKAISNWKRYKGLYVTMECNGVCPICGRRFEETEERKTNGFERV